MQLGISYNVGEGTQTVVAGPAAFIGWELANGTKASKLATDGIGIADLSELAWRQLQLTDPDLPPLEVWRKKLTDIQPTQVDPTQPQQVQ